MTKPRNPRAKRALRVVSSNISSSAGTPHSLHPLTSTTGNQIPPPASAAGPLASLNQRQSRKKQKLQESNRPMPEPRSHEELMKLTEAQLAIDARKYSKKAMSNADRAHFADFYHQQRRELCIQAIERGVSVPMVDEYLGKRIAVKKPTRFNHFMTTKSARGVFRGPRKGVKHKGAMTDVSGLWNKLSPEEKAAYQNGKPRTQPNVDTQPAGESDSDRASDYETDDDEEESEEAGTRKMASLKRAANTVQNFMDDCMSKAAHIAKTSNCEMIMFAVSRHLAAHSFQFGKATHGATKFLALAANLDGTKHYPARMQSYLTGYEVAEIAHLALSKRGKPKSRPVSVTRRMSDLVAEKTDGIMLQWPWTNTDWKLAKIKYKIQLLPGAMTQADWLKKPSRDLLATPKAIIHLDLDKKLIDLVYDPSIPDGVTAREFYGATPPSSVQSPSPLRSLPLS